MQIAQTILNQLGGSRFIAMTGAKNLLAIKDGLQFHLPARLAKDGINCVRILLEPTDTYKVEFGRIANVQRVPTYKVKTTTEMVYADKLAATFSQATGLATSL